MATESHPAATSRPRSISRSDVDSQEEADLCIAIDRVCVLGDLKRLHKLYQQWLAMRDAHPETLRSRKFRCFAQSVTLAAFNGQTSILNYLLQGHGLATNKHLCRSVVLTGIEARSYEVLEMMLETMWDVNEPEAYCEPGVFRHVLELTEDNEDLTQWFLDHGADPNASASVWDFTPLSYAVCYSPFSTIKLLFEVGGGDATKGELLQYAVTRQDEGRFAILEYLLDKGAPINKVKYANSPQAYASRAFLGLNPPLHRAVAECDFAMVRFLVEHGADPSIKGTKGITAIDEAVKLGKMEVADYFHSLRPRSSGFWAALGWR